jgi:P-type E1-E2 ATPase
LFVGKIDGNQTVLETALIRAISIVLISCPCAIGIAAPLAESQLIAGLAQMGAIVRNRGCLPLLGKASIFIFDKTGTLTEGKFEVLKGLEKLSLDELKILKTLTTQSNHLISLAIAKTLHREVEIIPFLSVQEHIGRGITTIYGGKRYSLGSRSFMEQFGAIVPIDGREYEGISSSVFFACDQKVITTIKLGDRVKEEAPELIKSLSPRKSILLSGDSEEAVQAVANYCGLDEWFHSYSPLQKKEFVDNLRKKGELICMLGDGINDAPALTGANVSISVVSATDMSIQVSDILLTTDSLSVISKMENLAKKGQRIIKQNLFWAFFYNVVGIFLAVLGILSPIFSAFAMTVSSLIVLFNAKRISRY